MCFLHLQLYILLDTQIIQEPLQLLDTKYCIVLGFGNLDFLE